MNRENTQVYKYTQRYKYIKYTSRVMRNNMLDFKNRNLTLLYMLILLNLITSNSNQHMTNKSVARLSWEKSDTRQL